MGNLWNLRLLHYGGMIMSNQFDSVTALNWTNGKVVWSYFDDADSPYETPYTAGNKTVNPWHTCGMIADGVYYTMNAEHSADDTNQTRLEHARNQHYHRRKHLATCRYTIRLN